MMPHRSMILHLCSATTSPGRWQFSLLAMLLSVLVATGSFANVRYVGDIVPVPDPNEDDGSSITGQDVLVGNTGLGGIFIDFTTTLSNPPTFDPLPVVSTSANLGVTIDGVGRVEITDNAWFLTSGGDEALVVGDAGYGLLDLFTSGLVDIPTGGMIVGDDITGQGVVTINTIASRLETNNLVVGNEGLGSILVTDTGSFVSTTSTIGDGLTGQGRVTLDDATRWDLRDRLTVGAEGIGDVVLNSTSNIISGLLAGDPNAVVLGRGTTGQGTVTLNESTRFFIDGGIVVGSEGWGTVNLNGSSSLISTEGTVGRGDGSTGHVTLAGSSRWDIRGDLGVGVAAGGDPNGSNAIGTLNINESSYVQVDADSEIAVARRGEINLNGGTLKHLPSTTSQDPIANQGIVRGSGTIDAELDIFTSGELRNAAGVADQREELLITLDVTVAGNSDGVYDTDADGLIESQGGEMEFHGLVTNDGVIVVNEAIMRFRGSEIDTTLTADLVNDGLVAIGPSSTIYGDISTNTGSVIVDLTNPIPGSPPIQVYGDLIFVPSLVAAITEEEQEEEEGEVAAIIGPLAGGLSFTIDDDPGVFQVLGEIILDAGSTIFDLTYASDVPSQPGDTFTVASASSITGDFFNSRVEADGFLWDIIVDNGTGDIMVRNAGTPFSGILGDFDGNGVVDFRDFFAWQRDPSIGDIADWTANYGVPTTANTTAVPEPSTLVLTFGLLTMRFRRRRK